MPLENAITETAISKAIVESYYRKLADRIESDVIIAGAGPSGLVAASCLAGAGKRVTIIEKRLSPGGGIWGGAMGMNQVVVQKEALPILEAACIRFVPQDGLYVADAAELACGLCIQALRAGAVLLNLVTLEDLCVRDNRVTGIVANRTTIAGALPVDPLVLSAGAVIDATGHDAAAVQHLRKRGLLDAALAPGEGPMYAAAGESFVVERVAEVYPGLWVTGMSVCTTFGGPRMGPIFGGMLLSGKRVAEMILAR
ncbi:MAG TPA: sulfide-dependent adenosine diphosphate thiazole synthase [Bryobacteraceae bacterium]|nr:sulfide-dependent adenosine diphosphate thiazole synthase [Bryobacteraceae bacterium]HOL72759.1 sulfide-dependent adenosine diphosphate thiazole synthase [Bryobacteraceae bacterium]HOQ45074.1 sulfide-dependent adenosine diphosphate thiazole synthase [Bryobacteraceae bacterium]HPQ15918.1 sulfide-dependent adenosine diphosphate thiazole synthase [Bryobacteraceae bacterium]HPU71146.1 sulfide-dependent adenosine diphosphate thiazole synthase [Bryobacteraceae bacterium]